MENSGSGKSSQVGSGFNVEDISAIEVVENKSSNSRVKKTKKSDVPEAVFEVKELIIAASLKLRGLKEDYQRIGWALEDLLEELDDVEAGEKTAKHKQSQSILREVEALIAKNADR